MAQRDAERALVVAHAAVAAGVVAANVAANVVAAIRRREAA